MRPTTPRRSGTASNRITTRNDGERFLGTGAPPAPPGRLGQRNLLPPHRYRTAVKELSGDGAGSHRTGFLEELEKHLQIWAKHVVALRDEKLSVARIKVRWMAFRGRQQSLAREADTLLGRTSERRENLRRLALGGAAPGDLNTRKPGDVDRFVEERV